MADHKELRREQIQERLDALDREKSLLLKELSSISEKSNQPPCLGIPVSAVPLKTSEERIALFTRLFRGREDVFAKLWENPSKGIKGYSPACKMEWVRGVCNKPRIKCSDCPSRVFIPFDEAVPRDHLEGKITAGTYALRENDTCVFLAADFDKDHWHEDILAYKQAGKSLGVDISIERSRSGNGGHAWIFFYEPVPAYLARQLGTVILTLAAAQRYLINFDSYDRFFPSQDTVPKGGFGNLIALPLQRIPRKIGNSVFVDDKFNPFPDQWEYLRTIRLLSCEDIVNVLRKNTNPPVSTLSSPPANPDIVEADSVLELADSKIKDIYHGEIVLRYGRVLEIVSEGLPSRLIAAFKRTGTFANPKFFELQRMRFSTWKTPRYICCAELSDDGTRMILPRGLLSQIYNITRIAGANMVVSDLRKSYETKRITFKGDLLSPQKKALRDLIIEDAGILVAPPGAGKTVIACAYIAKRKLPTLILVHRKQLVDQWKKQLVRFTNLTKKEIRTYSGDGIKGIVDIGMLQTISREKSPQRIINDYGIVIVDECHHIPAASFEPVLKRISARHFLGLTATPYRKDGLEKIISMQCGPVLHTMTETMGQLQIMRRVIVRESSFRIPCDTTLQLPLHEIWQTLVNDTDRLKLVASDVIASLTEGRFPLVLSDRKNHLEKLLNEIKTMQIGDQPVNGFILTSDIGKRNRDQILSRAKELFQKGEKPFLLSTGSLIGEGFDLPELSTLVLAMPLSFKGRLVQYAGRLHRESPGKTDVRIYDYVDINFGLGITMFRKRLATYRKMGYKLEMPEDSLLK
jgi:superfamily II DNA or RNA helicase